MRLTTQSRSFTAAPHRLSATAAFTLIEMIGVLAVIAILAALLIPRIFEAINNARINNAVVSCSTVKAAVADHYAKFGAIAIDGTATPPVAIPVPTNSFDQLLLSEGFLDKPFQVKIGDGNPTNTTVRISAALPGTTTVDGSNAAYDLGGTLTNSAVGTVVVEAVISNVLLNDARDLNDRLDGTTLGVDSSGNDYRGRVKYTTATPVVSEVHVYLTHR